MATVRVRVLQQDQLVDGNEELLNAEGVKWIDVTAPDEATLQSLATKFGLHRLAIEDCLHLDQRPKLEDYGTHQFLVLQGFNTDSATWKDMEMLELHFFLGPDWLITVHNHLSPSIEATSRRVAADPKGTMGRGVDFVTYLIADALVDRNFPLLECFNDELEELEERIFSSAPSREMLRDLFELKHALVRVRRVLSPQRDVVGLLARHGISQVNERTTIYFRDVYDHLVRIYEQIDGARDLVSSAVEAYMSQIANRTGEISKQLTVFASIFMPLSFVVGFFGQNFEGIARHEYLAPMLATMVLLPTGMILWFRHKRWF
jgi:magnesium transporter